MVFSYFFLLKLIVELVLIFSAYKIIKTRFSKDDKFNKNIKIAYLSLLGIIIYVISTLNFNFAKNEKLDQKRIEEHSKAMIQKSEIKEKVLPNIIKVKDISTTNYIEQQANQIHENINKKEK